jgi:uncharacterized protein (DUF305 family)
MMRRQWQRWRGPILLVGFLAIALLAAPNTLAATAPRFQQLHPMAGQPLDQLTGDAFDQAFLTQMTMHHSMGVMMTQPVITRGAHQELKDLGAQMIADQSREIGQMRGWLQSWYGLDVTCPMAQGTMPGMTPGWMPGPNNARPGPGRMMPGSMVPSADMPPMPGMMPGMGPGTMPGMAPGMMPGMAPGMMPGMAPGMMPGGPMMGMPMMGGPWSLPPDQLDAAFMTSMIAHHQGAIDMAALAEERADRQEVKDLAAGIITSQTAEIELMRGWLLEWYGR